MPTMQPTTTPGRPITQRGGYYGWVIVGVLGAFSAISVALAGPNLAIFIKPMQEELGWSASVFGWAQFARLVTVVFAGPIIGRLLDRHGPRIPIAVASAVAAGTVVTLAYVHSEWQLIALFVLTGLLGMGRAVDLYVSPSVSKWFVRGRGRAMSMAFIGTPVGVMVFFPGSQLLIEAVGWRTAWLIFGTGAGLVLVPLALVFLRRQPEDMGLAPDGDPVAAVAAVDAPEQDDALEVSWTRAEALRNRTFWLMVAGFGLYTFSWSTLTIFRVPHYIERGMGPLLVTLAVATDSAVAIAVSPIVGRLLGRVVPAHAMMAIGIAGLLVSAVGAVVVHSALWMFISTIGFGFGIQVGNITQNVMWADYFGRRHQGAIRGLTLPLILGLGALAYPLTGIIRDVTGVYTPAWFLAMAGFIGAAAILVPLRAPRRPRR